jgi:peptidoglycan biosynthesis protein MviN/MurJ (putative lipid II flippase)
MPDYPAKVGFLAAAVQIIGMLVLVPKGGSLAMAGMMSAFFIINTGVLLWKSLRELQAVERRSSTDSPQE